MFIRPEPWRLTLPSIRPKHCMEVNANVHHAGALEVNVAVHQAGTLEVNANVHHAGALEVNVAVYHAGAMTVHAAGHHNETTHETTKVRNNECGPFRTFAARNRSFDNGKLQTKPNYMYLKMKCLNVGI